MLHGGPIAVANVHHPDRCQSVERRVVSTRMRLEIGRHTGDCLPKVACANVFKRPSFCTKRDAGPASMWPPPVSLDRSIQGRWRVKSCDRYYLSGKAYAAIATTLPAGSAEREILPNSKYLASLAA